MPCGIVLCLFVGLDKYTILESLSKAVFVLCYLNQCFTIYFYGSGLMPETFLFGFWLFVCFRIAEVLAIGTVI